MNKPMSMAEAEERLTREGAPFEMRHATILGRPVRFYKNAPPSLRFIFENSLAFRERTYLVYEDERVTFGEHAENVCRLATALRERYGVRKGDRVAFAMRNLPEWPMVFWAIVSLGAIAVPLNAWWTGPELEYGIQNSESHLVIVDGERLERLRPHLAGLGLRGVIATRHTGSLDAGVDDLKSVIEAVPKSAALPPAEIDPDDDATIFYTSGTTGKPKGALGTHRNMATNVWNYRYAVAFADLRRGNIPPILSGQPVGQMASLLTVPFFHVTGCHSTLAINTFLGNKIVLMHKWDPERALQLIEREKITSFGGVPTMVWQITETPGFKKADVSSIQNMFYGGAVATVEILPRIEAGFPNAQAVNGYGMTETSSIATTNPGLDYKRKPDSVGWPSPVVDLKIAGPNGESMPAGQPGEIWMYGPNIMKEYWKMPEATAAAVTDGWMHSGDLGYRDEEGFVYLIGRIKDMLIRGGENVYCAEVEAALFTHEAIMDAAVFGMPDRVLGEEVAAIVQVRPGFSLTPDELHAHVATRIAAYKVPVLIEMRPEPLERNANGKIVKRELQKSFAGQRVVNVRKHTQPPQ